jgi:D-xylose 1-dehydrogenase (NADP+, D-xylono-1,5-lactone-forming)
VTDMQPVGWGVLGAARVVRRRFLPALREASNARLVALGSRGLDRAEVIVREVAQGRAVRSYQAVLEDPAVDVVYIALPNALHFDWAVKALSAGKHVLCEKPLALSVAQVDELAQVSEQSERVLMEGFMYRLHPQYQPAVWQSLHAEIGTLRTVHARFSYPFNRQGDIRENATLGGGALWDIGCYCLDWLCWQLGEAAAAQALGDVRAGCNWATAVSLRFTSGVLATAWWSFAGPISQRVTLVGGHGVLDLDSPFRATGPATAWLEVDGHTRSVPLPNDNAFRREIEHVGKVIRGQAVQAIPLSDSRRWLGIAETVDRQVRATKDSAKIVIDPTDVLRSQACPYSVPADKGDGPST